MTVMESNLIHERLIEIFMLWQPTYVLQENYQLLETYMGIDKHMKILPDVSIPRTWKIELDYSNLAIEDVSAEDFDDSVRWPSHSPASQKTTASVAIVTPGIVSTQASLSPTDVPQKGHTPMIAQFTTTSDEVYMQSASPSGGFEMPMLLPSKPEQVHPRPYSSPTNSFAVRHHNPY